MASIPIKVGIIGGSGFYQLETLEDSRANEVNTPWGVASVVEGVVGGVAVVVMARHGTGHSITPGEVNYRANIWALKTLGVTQILAATACGSLREEIPPGLLVLLDSFIDRTQGRAQSFYSKDGLPGVCHIPMEPAFCPRLRCVLSEEAAEQGVTVREGGTVVTLQGPRFSSLAESKMFRMWGADVVNMTTVPEVVLAKEAGISYAAIAVPTDWDCWKEGQGVVDVESVMKVFASNITKVKSLIVGTVIRIGLSSWDETINANRTAAASSIVPGSDNRV